MRLKTLTFVRLERRVARFIVRCGWCGYLAIPLDAIFVPVVSGRALGFFCRERCASAVVKVPMVVSYAAAA